MNSSRAILTAVALALAACGGGGGSSNSDGGTSKVSFAIADAPIDSADKVVITVDKVILRRNGDSDVVVERFTIPSLGVTDADTFQIDLLDYQHGLRALVVDDLVIPSGNYAHLILKVLDENVNYSFVRINGADTPIKQPSEELKLGGFSVIDTGVYTFTLDFDLRKALTYNPGPNRYILKPRGVNIVSDALASTLSGTVDDALFDVNTIPACASKTDPTIGNVVYLYQGHALDQTKLTDVYDPDIATGVPVGALNPYAAANVYQDQLGQWRYTFGYMPAGNYTLAFSCNAAGDFAESYDGIDIPLPIDQLHEVVLTAGQTNTCSLPVSGGVCAP